MKTARHIGRLALPLVALAAPVTLALAPRDGAPVIVIAADSAEAAAIVAFADGRILAEFGRFGLVARAEAPGFSARLYRAGAMLVVDAAGRGGCLAQSGRS